MPLYELSKPLRGFTSDASSPPSLGFPLEYVAKLMPILSQDLIAKAASIGFL
jgi:hypothetical protein